VALEHMLDGLQIELGGHVADAAIFLVERLGGIRAFAVALHQMAEHLPVAHQVGVQVHGEEAGQLQEAGIHLAPRAG
jgi:hypothetical protein